MDISASSPVDDVSINRRIEIASDGRLPVYDGTTLPTLTALGFSMDEIYRFVAPRRTIARRIANREPLTVAENDSALRLVRVIDHADQVFGDRDKALRWLRKPSRALNGIAPIDLLESETGAHLVEQALYQIEFGIYV